MVGMLKGSIAAPSRSEDSSGPWRWGSGRVGWLNERRGHLRRGRSGCRCCYEGFERVGQCRGDWCGAVTGARQTLYRRVSPTGELRPDALRLLGGKKTSQRRAGPPRTWHLNRRSGAPLRALVEPTSAAQMSGICRCGLSCRVAQSESGRGDLDAEVDG